MFSLLLSTNEIHDFQDERREKKQEKFLNKLGATCWTSYNEHNLA